MNRPPLDKRDWIAGLEKGLAILESFDSEHARLTPSQAAQLTGMTRTAARRYLLTLEHLGYVQGDGKLYGLTPRVLRVGWSYFDSARLPKTVQPYLQQLSATINESVYVSVLDDWELVFIARNGTSRVMTTGFVLGARACPPRSPPPASCCSHITAIRKRCRRGSTTLNSSPSRRTRSRTRPACSKRSAARRPTVSR